MVVALVACICFAIIVSGAWLKFSDKISIYVLVGNWTFCGVILIATVSVEYAIRCRPLMMEFDHSEVPQGWFDLGTQLSALVEKITVLVEKDIGPSSKATRELIEDARKQGYIKLETKIYLPPLRDDNGPSPNPKPPEPSPKPPEPSPDKVVW